MKQAETIEDREMLGWDLREQVVDQQLASAVLLFFDQSAVDVLERL